LLIGAVTTFLVAGIERQRLSGAHPEQFLAVWQKEAESHLSNPLLFVAGELVLYNVHLESRGTDRLRCRQLSEICNDILARGPVSASEPTFHWR
jgi:hypothetical protein